MNKFLFALVVTGAILFTLAGCADQATPTTSLAQPSATATTASLQPGATATRAPQASGICGQGDPPAYLKSVVLAKSVTGKDISPVDVTDEFAPNQPAFHAVATIEKALPGVKLYASWYLVQASGFQPNTKIDDSQAAVDNDGTGNVDFTLKPSAALWPPGTYCVEIYTDGNLALSKTFKVVGGASPALVNPIQEIVLALDINPNTRAPVNPTQSFKTSSPFIYATVRIKDSPPGTIYKAKWYPPGMEPLETVLEPGPELWLDFHLTPGDAGFPAGDYKVEFYVNEQLADTKTFKVE